MLLTHRRAMLYAQLFPTQPNTVDDDTFINWERNTYICDSYTENNRKKKYTNASTVDTAVLRRARSVVTAVLRRAGSVVTRGVNLRKLGWLYQTDNKQKFGITSCYQKNIEFNRFMKFLIQATKCVPYQWNIESYIINMSLQHMQIPKNAVFLCSHVKIIFKMKDIYTLKQPTARNIHVSSQRGVHNYDEHKL